MEHDFLSRGLFGIFRIRTSKRSIIYYSSLIPIYFIGSIAGILFPILISVLDIELQWTLSSILNYAVILYLLAHLTMGDAVVFSKDKVTVIKLICLFPYRKVSTDPSNCFIENVYRCGSRTSAPIIDMVLEIDFDSPNDYVDICIDDKQSGGAAYNDKILWATIQNEAKRYIPYWPENSINNE